MTEQNLSPQVSSSKEDEIDITPLIITLWDGRKSIISFTIFFFVISFFVAILSPKQYAVKATLVPQSSSGAASKLGGLSSLAALAGFNMDLGTTAELSPEIYPEILQSVPFQLELLKTELNFKDIDQAVSLYDYYTDEQYQHFISIKTLKKYTIELPSLIVKALKRNDNTEIEPSKKSKLITISEEQNSLLKLMSEIVTLDVNQTEGKLYLTAWMPEALAAAQLGQTAMELLQNYITKYKTEKAQEQLDFIQDRFNVKKGEFEKAQIKLADFRDRNKNVSTAMAQTEVERLQSEYQISFSVYNELAKQLEAAKIQVKQETPVLTVIEPIVVPYEKSKPKRTFIVFFGTFLGFIVGLGWVFGKVYLVDVVRESIEQGAGS